ncbi:hypothetical protein F4809DRAFT_633504 [Biscogniauxia mediterranea]|nr:hypothetical protein F4809DRAFT_633504 [Biscogniauxia mediterranea]
MCVHVYYEMASFIMPFLCLLARLLVPSLSLSLSQCNDTPPMCVCVYTFFFLLLLNFHKCWCCARRPFRTNRQPPYLESLEPKLELGCERKEAEGL